jgi:hypothetical protein
LQKFDPPRVITNLEGVVDAALVNNLYGDDADHIYLACGGPNSTIKEIRRGISVIVEATIEVSG